MREFADKTSLVDAHDSLSTSAVLPEFCQFGRGTLRAQTARTNTEKHYIIMCQHMPTVTFCCRVQNHKLTAENKSTNVNRSPVKAPSGISAFFCLSGVLIMITYTIF